METETRALVDIYLLVHMTYDEVYELLEEMLEKHNATFQLYEVETEVKEHSI